MRCRIGMRTVVLAAAAIGHVTTPAWADRAAAEKLAKAAHDDASFVACGQAFLDVYNADPADLRADEVVFNAARCFESGKSISAALQADTLVIKSFPRSKLAAKSIVRSGAMYAQIAMYDRAAERFEDYAKRYAGEKAAGDWMTEAIRLRAALGDAVKQIEDTKYWIKTFGMKGPHEAAAADLALLSVYDGDDAIRLLHDYLAHYATVDPDQTIVAHVELAHRLRAKACPVRAIDGLCVKIVVDRAPHCGPGTTNVVAVTRTAANREALAEYRAAVALAKTATKDPAARHAQAMARLALADDDLETLLATPMPRDLAFAHGNSKRLSQWLDANNKLREKLDSAYSEVLLQKDATSSVAAAARFGEASLAMWRAVMASELPSDSRLLPAAKDTYCKELKDAAEPFRARAIETAWTCIAKARELEAGQEWADMCWRDGAMLDPVAFAPVREQRGTASQLALPIALEPPVASPPPP